MSTKTTAAELIPREVIFGNPKKVSPKLSPDGSMLAYIAPVDGVLNVLVGKVGADDYQPVTEDRDRGVRVYFWAHDSERILYLQDVGGDENWRLHSVNLESGDTTTLTPYDNVQVQIVDYDKHFPHELLVAMNKEDEKVHDVYHLDLRTGDIELTVKNPGNVIGWVTDAQLQVRGAHAARPDGGIDLLVRRDTESDWETLITWNAEDSLTSSAISFTKDGDALYLQDSRSSNAAKLVRLAIETGEVSVIAEDPIYDVDEIVIHPDTYEVQMVSFNRARREWLVLDDSIKSDVDEISRLEDGDFMIYDRTHSDDRWLIAVNRDRGPVSYHEYDRTESRGHFLFYARPELTEYSLAEMEPISFTSRDGLTIHGYITYPVGVARKNLPIVLLVHGGPWVRDVWGYDPEAQWLANRGYACLQINYRGSTGYGKEFLNAGDKEWGGKMHDDLVDGVKWAIQKQMADRERVAIYGGSYGGYAALVGATFTPDLFCCAVDIVGPSNLVTFVETIPPYWSSYRSMIYQRVGNPESEEEFLKSRSPLFKVDQIKIPMLIAQGANDPRVKQAESEQIVSAMEDKGIDHEYLIFPDEGHGFAKPENRLKFYAAAEKFLAKHLGGRAED